MYMSVCIHVPKNAAVPNISSWKQDVHLTLKKVQGSTGRWVEAILLICFIRFVLILLSICCSRLQKEDEIHECGTLGTHTHTHTRLFRVKLEATSSTLASPFSAGSSCFSSWGSSFFFFPGLPLGTSFTFWFLGAYNVRNKAISNYQVSPDY